jgi:hypothetical protein
LPTVNVWNPAIMWPIDPDATFMPFCYQVQGKQDYNDMLHISDTHHNSQYVVVIHIHTCPLALWFDSGNLQGNLFLIGFELASYRTLDKTIANLETELSAARTLQDSFLNGSPVQEDYKASESTGRRKYLMVIGINTAFSSRKRRDSIRNTWMPKGFSHTGSL